MAADAAGWNWFQIIGVAGSIASIVAIFLHYADTSEQVERWVEKDPECRQDLAQRLRGARIGSLYRGLLKQGLDWLDRHWGSPSSARALGVCIIIALCYAWAAFFVGWGAGGPGYIGGAPGTDGMYQGGILLLGEMAQPWRGLLALGLVVAPPLAFLFGRWLARQERRLKVGLRRRYRWRRVPLEVSYRIVLLFGTLFAIEANLPGPLVGLFAIVAIGPGVGIAAWRRSPRDFWGGILAFGGGVAAVAVAFAAIFAGAGVGAVAFAVALAGAVAFAVAGAGVGAVTVAFAVAGAGVGAVAFTAAFAGAVAGAVGAATARREHRGAYAGGIGAMAGLGLESAWFGGGAADEGVVALLIFFLVLPVVNGFWDWLSWWITRALGRHLLRTLGPARGVAYRSLAILGHGVVDLVLAVLLLAAMAFLLAFGFEGYNQLAEAQGKTAFELAPFLAQAAEHPWSDGLWLTVMLLSTLFPTALHVVALLASPIALLTLPTAKRLALAGDLESWKDQAHRHANIQRRAGQWVARERHGAIALAAGLFVLLVGGLLALINAGLGLLDPDQSVAHLLLWVAERGIDLARGRADAVGL